MLGRAGHPARAVVHHLAGARLHRAHAAGRAARRVCLRALRLPRQAAAAGGGHRAVRAADRRRRHGLPGAASGAAGCWTSCGAYGWTPRCGRSCSRTSSSTTRSSYGPSAGCGRSSTRARRRPRGCWARAGSRPGGRVTLPALGPAVAAAALMVFLFTFTSFGVVQILGGPDLLDPRGGDLPADLRALRPATAAVLTLIQFVAVRRVLAAARLDRTAPGDRAAAGGRVRDRPAAARARGSGRCWPGSLAIVAVLLVLPLAVLVRAVARRAGGYGFGYYRALTRSDGGGTFLVAPIEAVGNSLRYAARRHRHRAGRSAGSRRRADPAGRGPVRPRLRRAADAAARGLRGDRRLRVPDRARRAAAGPAGLLDPGAARPGAGRACPSSCGPCCRCCGRWTHRLREAAAVLGASPLRVWREVDLPMVRRALLIAAGFAFAVSLGEFGATVFIARPDNPTLPVAVARLLGRAGELNYGQAMALFDDPDGGVRGGPAGAGAAAAPTGPGSSDDCCELDGRRRVRFGGRRRARRGRIWTSPSTRSCVCWGRAAAASPRCCGWSPGSNRSTRAGCCSTGATRPGCPRTGAGSA